MNNYKILIKNNDVITNLRIGNYLSNLNTNNFIINKKNYSFIKITFVLLLFFAFRIKTNFYSKLNKSAQKLEEKKENPAMFYNCTFLKNEMHTYSLYDTFKFPQISLILMSNEFSKINSLHLIDQIKYIFSQDYKNIEIILYLHHENKREYNIIKHSLRKHLHDKSLKIYNKKGDLKEIFFNLINLVTGLYTIFINSLDLIKDLQLGKYFEFTRGKIDNFFNFSIPEQSSIYLLKSKCLKEFIDNGIEFNSFNMIKNYMISIPIPKLNYIHISLCPDNHFTELAYVSMSSILSSKSTYTYICFYIIIPSNFQKKNINFLNSLYEENEYFNITFIQMDDRYDKAYTDRRITSQAYYRFSLGELLPNLNKIIYIDADIIAYKDLTKFYNLNFNGKMILGQPTYGHKDRRKHGFNKINTGILLLNLVEMRKNKFEKKVIEIIKKVKKLSYHDQTLLNDYFRQYIGIFPPEYHTRPWSNYKEMAIFNYKIGKPFDTDYFYFSHKYPTIRHFLGRYKPKNPNINHIEDWWFFARKSKYYNKSATRFDSAFSFLI